MPAISPQREKANRNEILSAAEKLYAKKDFRDISLTDIASLTSLSRPSIYNYFRTKEEIFLGLLDREHALWASDVRKIDPAEVKSKATLAEALTKTLQKRKLMLRLLVSNLYDMENNSSLEALVAFKKTYWETVEAVRDCVNRCLPRYGEARTDAFIELLFPFVFGIYPYTAHSKKQKEALKMAKIPMREPSIYDIARPGIERLLG